MRATTSARVATSTYASPMAAGGLLLLVLLHAVTTWVRARRMSALRISITAVTVLPFAVWYGRGEPRRRRAKKKSLLFLLSRRPRRVKPQVLREKSKLIQKSVDAFGAKWCIV